MGKQEKEEANQLPDISFNFSKFMDHILKEEKAKEENEVLPENVVIKSKEEQLKEEKSEKSNEAQYSNRDIIRQRSNAPQDRFWIGKRRY